MGEYEERYPEAYGRGEERAQPTPREEVLQPAPPQQVRDRPLFRSRFGLGAAAETAPAWQHGPTERERPPAPRTPSVEPAQPRLIEPTRTARRADGTYRGLGPRGYVRSPERIYEDICDRLTDNPFIDASDIEVTVEGSQIVLTGSVENRIALRQAEEIAAEVAGVSHIDNRLTVRSAGEAGEASPGDLVNRAMGVPGGR